MAKAAQSKARKPERDSLTKPSSFMVRQERINQALLDYVGTQMATMTSEGVDVSIALIAAIENE